MGNGKVSGKAPQFSSDSLPKLHWVASAANIAAASPISIQFSKRNISKYIDDDGSICCVESLNNHGEQQSHTTPRLESTAISRNCLRHRDYESNRFFSSMFHQTRISRKIHQNIRQWPFGSLFILDFLALPGLRFRGILIIIIMIPLAFAILLLLGPFGFFGLLLISMFVSLLVLLGIPCRDVNLKWTKKGCHGLFHNTLIPSERSL